MWMEVLCWIDRVWFSKECACCACDMLKLNDDKTELIVFTSKYKQDVYNYLSITIGDAVMDCSSQVKDLGVIFDRVLSLRLILKKTCRFHLRNISRIRKYIPQDTRVVLIKSLRVWSGS